MFKNKEYVLAVYKEKSFTRAAEKLFVSQPSLSASIKRIEDKIGAPIFDRSASPVRLTEIGEEYIKTALEISASEANFERYLADGAGMISGKIRIGGSSFFSAFVIPGLISKFKAKYEKTTFEIVEGSTKNLLAMLSLGEIDVVVDNATVTDDTVLSVEHATERLLLAVPRALSANERLSHLALSAKDVKNNLHISKEAVALSHFADESFILLHNENDTGKRADALLKEENVAPRVTFRLDQQITAYNMCASGLGVTFVSDTLVKQSGTATDILYYALPDATRSICFYIKRNRYHSAACRKFLQENGK